MNTAIHSKLVSFIWSIADDCLRDVYVRKANMAVDLSTYGLERVKLNTSIGLDASESQLEPQNPNPRGAHGDEPDKDPLDLIVKSFNEKWFHGWEATPDEQRVKFVQLAQSMRAHPDFVEKYASNQDAQNREIAFRRIFDEVIARQRKTELDLYRKVTNDDAFKVALQDTVRRILSM